MPILHIAIIRLLEDQLAPPRGLAQEPEHILLRQVNAQSAESFTVQHRVRLLFFSASYGRDEQTEAERGTEDDGYLHVHCGDMGFWGFTVFDRLSHVFGPTPKAARTPPALPGPS